MKFPDTTQEETARQLKEANPHFPAVHSSQVLDRLPKVLAETESMDGIGFVPICGS
jgi:hypothetical protein